MDQFRGALNSFTGGGNQQQGQQYQQQQPQGEGFQQPQHQQQSGGGGDFLGGLSKQFGSFTGGGNQQQHQQQVPQGEGSQHQSGGAGGFLGGLTNKFNSAAGGGPESEKNEDYLDKGVDFVQEKFLGQGPQNNESAVEQAKDEQISDFIRDKYKSATGKEFFIKDKETRFG